MAGGFVFKLETLLKVRRREMQAAQRVVAQRLRVIGEIEETIRQVNQCIEREYRQVRGALAGHRLDTRTIIRSGDYVAALRGRNQANKNGLAEQRRALTTEREALVRASVKVKALENLRERRLAEYRRQENRRQRREEDENSVNAYLRSRREVLPHGSLSIDYDALARVE